ncbi:hypothetical protein ACJX0J_025230, partial [Zea mays]
MCVLKKEKNLKKIPIACELGLLGNPTRHIVIMLVAFIFSSTTGDWSAEYHTTTFRVMLMAASTGKQIGSEKTHSHIWIRVHFFLITLCMFIDQLSYYVFITEILTLVATETLLQQEFHV